MDGKTWAIAGLVVVALVLGGIVSSGLRQERMAYGQGGVYSAYLVVTAEVRDDNVDFVVLDTATRRLIFYSYDQSKKKLGLNGGMDLARDFQRKGP
jgi:hypothetical protein